MELAKGNRIVVRSRMSINIITIERVTAKQAFSGHYKFKKEYGENGRVTQIGGDSSIWNSTYFSVSDDKSETEFKRQSMIRKLKDTKWNDMDYDALVRVFNCI